jgi:hypothetical protein
MQQCEPSPHSVPRVTIARAINGQHPGCLSLLLRCFLIDNRFWKYLDMAQKDKAQLMPAA